VEVSENPWCNTIFFDVQYFVVRMFRNNLAVGIALSSALVWVTGCKHGGTVSPAIKRNIPSPSPTPFPVAVQAQGLHTTIFDTRGRIVAKVRASGATIAPDASISRSNPIGNMQTAFAILYQNNIPTATIHADTMTADRNAETLVGNGNVVLVSLTQPDSPTIRADTMTYLYKKDKIFGSGNVLITRKPDLQIPEKSFTADTQLRTYTALGGSTPATGRL
jgi:hypothetical protein